MAISLSARASDPAPGSRGFPWPVLEQGNASFAEGVYSIGVEHRDPGKSFELTHEISGADLINRWIAEGKVKFACAAAAPTSAYRELHVSDSATHLIAWNPDDLGEPPKFTPMIVATRDFEHVVNSSEDGASPLWDGKTIRLAKGSRVAIFPTFGLRAGMMGLLEFRLNEDLAPGRFEIEATTAGGFKFKVDLARDLFNYLSGGARRNDATGANVMTHIVSAALSHLKDRYANDDGEEGWRSFPNLRALAEHMDSEGLRHWSDENFSAASAATALYPHKLPETDDR